MSNKPGKKVGTIHIELNRDKSITRWGHGRDKAKVEVELRLDSHTGLFHASRDGKWYKAATKAEIEEKIRAAVDRTVDVEWERYIVVDYNADASRVDERTRRPEQNSHSNYSLNADRAKLQGDPESGSRYEREDSVITGIALTWDVCEYTRPWKRPEDGKLVRSKREVRVWFEENDNGEEVLTEHFSDPREQDDDELPAGAVLWTAERDAFLHQVLVALGKLDARMCELFRGAPEDLAKRLDDASPTLLLGGAS